MPSQVEGSYAVAKGVALCRPEVISAYPISPQTHIVENLSDLVRTGELAPCEYLNVESEFSAMSAAIGASAAGARAYTATASQGLLYMAEALYNASGLGLPIVMTVANRAIGAPINIWNDHSDSMSQRDSGWIQLYAESNQEALDLHIQAFKLAEELSLPVMVCMDGFILTHAYEQVEIPTQEQVDAFLPPFEPRQVLDPERPGHDRGDGRAGGVHGGPLPHAREADAGARPRTRDRRRVRAVVRTQRREACSAATEARTPRRSSWRSARCSARSRTSSTSCATRACSIGAVGLKCFRPYPLEELRAALGHARQIVVLEKAFSVGVGRHSSARTCELALSGLDLVRLRRGRGARRATDHEGVAPPARRRRARGQGRAGSADLPRPQRELVERELMRASQKRRSGPHAENMLRDLGIVGRGVALRRSRMATQQIKLYQVGTFAVGNRLLSPDERTVQARMERSNTLTSGHRACQGCGEALGARYVLDAAMRATEGRLIAANATGCLEVFSTPYPESSWQLPWLHSLFANAPAVASGIAAALKVKGTDRHPGHRPGRRRRDDGHRLRLPLRDVRAR